MTSLPHLRAHNVTTHRHTTADCHSDRNHITCPAAFTSWRLRPTLPETYPPLAPPLPHPLLTRCLQCPVERSGPLLVAAVHIRTSFKEELKAFKDPLTGSSLDRVGEGRTKGGRVREKGRVEGSRMGR